MMFSYLLSTIALGILCILPVSSGTEITSNSFNAAKTASVVRQGSSIIKFNTKLTKVSSGITVSDGTAGTLRFKITVNKGVDARTLAFADQRFLQIIESAGALILKNRYLQLRRNFKGDLNIPFLLLLGYILDTSAIEPSFYVNQFTPLDAYLKPALSNEALRILSSFTGTVATASGEFTARGTSSTPTTIAAFVKTSRVEFGNGLFINIISGKKLVFGGPAGEPQAGKGFLVVGTSGNIPPK